MGEENKRTTYTLPVGDALEFDGANYPELVSLDCSTRNCELLNVSQNRKLEDLNCSINSLVSLDVSACENLKSLDCSFNLLEELFLPAVSDLKILDCSHNNLTSLDLSGAADLSEIYCDANQELTSLEFPSWEDEPVFIEFLDISNTALTPEWLADVSFFPRPREGCEDQLFIFGSPLAEDKVSVEKLKEIGWKPVIEEE